MSSGGVTLAPIEHYLAALWERGGSDLLITANSPPLMRIDGQLIPIPDEPSLDQESVEQLVLGVLTDDLRQELRADREVDFSFSYNDVARFRANCYFQMGAIAIALRMIPLEAPDLRGARPATRGRVLLQPAPRARPRHGSDGLGQVHVARGDHRLHQHPPSVPHHHDRGPGRVRPPAQVLGGESARGGQRHPQLRPGAARRVA